jgi:hypothetical protein
MRVGILKENLLHVTNQLYKQGIFVQIRWTRCNKTYNIQCCQHHALIRILPDSVPHKLFQTASTWLCGQRL